MKKILKGKKMIKQLIVAFLLITGFAFGQLKVERSITFTDSVSVTDSILVPTNMYLSTLRTGDLNKIASFAIQYKMNGIWYSFAVASGSTAYAVAVRDNCVVALDHNVFSRVWDPSTDGKAMYLRLVPNDGDTTSRTVILEFEDK